MSNKSWYALNHHPNQCHLSLSRSLSLSLFYLAWFYFAYLMPYQLIMGYSIPQFDSSFKCLLIVRTMYISNNV